ncbi:unnamed protein product [Linum tenue]|uniref:Uncharacterized protein n=1 Tax=Linum tenue TaxID=586396 RepID=A0AAV0PX22_9ROSI|nr:unnamed protein product [Linum tenue]
MVTGGRRDGGGEEGGLARACRQKKMMGSSALRLWISKGEDRYELDPSLSRSFQIRRLELAERLDLPVLVDDDAELRCMVRRGRRQAAGRRVNGVCGSRSEKLGFGILGRKMGKGMRLQARMGWWNLTGESK